MAREAAHAAMQNMGIGFAAFPQQPISALRLLSVAVSKPTRAK